VIQVVSDLPNNFQLLIKGKSKYLNYALNFFNEIKIKVKVRVKV